MTTGYITPGEQSRIREADVPDFVHEEWDIVVGDVMERPSHTGRVFTMRSMATRGVVFGDNAVEAEIAEGEDLVFKAFPNKVPASRLYLADALSDVLNAADIHVDGDPERIKVQKYLSTIVSSDAVAWHGNNPTILARLIPGEKLSGDASPLEFDRLAEMHAKVHNHFQDPKLLRAVGDDESLKITNTDGYMERFTRQTPEIIAQMPEAWRAILDVVDENFPYLPQGVVPVSMWMGDVPFLDGRPRGLYDINETEHTSPLLCKGMSVWGLYVATGSFEAVTRYAQVYQEHRELTPPEVEQWPYHVVARAIMSWQGAKLVEHLTPPGERSAAQRDEERINTLHDRFRESGLVSV